MRPSTNPFKFSECKKYSWITLLFYLSLSISVASPRNFRKTEYTTATVIQASQLAIDANQVRPVSLLTSHQLIVHNSTTKNFSSGFFTWPSHSKINANNPVHKVDPWLTFMSATGAKIMVLRL